ncbi:hypothetical protein [Bdellovibrio sp. HCB337]|uniref:hypothetical protein n=1 Tax=Bdellovibrio sp. HCB337 TaxID=3394358 RepID=UPI0039A4B9E8
MKKLQFVVIIALLVAVGSAYRQLHQIQEDLVERNPSSSTSSAATNSQAESATAVANPKFAELIKQEAAAMSQLTKQPEEIQKRLKDLAGKMQEGDVTHLQESALDTSLNGDERFLSVYVLGESALAKAQESLEQIAMTPIPSMKEARLTNQEEILRVQAVESLRHADSLKRVLASTDNSFISDRAQRNLLFREGKVTTSPEQQDQEALTQLLKKSHQ